MDRLLRTSLYRALLKSPTRKVVSENRLRNYFHDFARQVTAIGDDTDALSALRTLNYAHVQFHSLLRRVSEQGTPPPHYLSRFIDMAIEFIRMEKELLYYRLEHSQYFISGSAPQSPLYWSKEHSAISVSEILCGLDRMTPKPLLLADGTAAPFNLVGLRGYVACQTRRSDRCQTPCSGAQKGSHEIYRGITLHLEQGGRITIFTVTFYIHPDIRVCNWES